MDDTALKISFASALSEVSPEEWNALANPPGTRFDPFLKWEFLESMESSGAATTATGWMPRHILVRDGQGRVRGGMPLYGTSRRLADT